MATTPQPPSQHHATFSSSSPLPLLLPPFLQREVAHFDHHAASGTLTPQIVRRFRQLGEHIASIERESLKALVELAQARHRQRLDHIAAFETDTDNGRIMSALENLTDTLRNLLQEHALEINIDGDLENVLFEDVAVTLPSEQLDSLPLTVVASLVSEGEGGEENGGEGGGENCTVCHEPLHVAGNVLRTLRCDHRFHRQCIDEWLLNRSVRCPLCRMDQRRASSTSSTSSTASSAAADSDSSSTSSNDDSSQSSEVDAALQRSTIRPAPW